MRHHRTQVGSDEHRSLQRAIVGVLLGEEHDGPWTREHLAASVHADRSVLDQALERLQADQIAVLDDERVLPSRCARRLEELGLLGL
jgi:hypothetical protein